MKYILLVVLIILLTGCVKGGSSRVYLGHDYYISTTTGSEGWSVNKFATETHLSGNTVIDDQVSLIGTNKQYIVGLRVQGDVTGDPHKGIPNIQPYGYFIINKYTDEKTMGLSEREAKKAFGDLNISMNLLKGTSRLYTWEDK